MTANEDCKKCPWKYDAGNKYVCMFNSYFKKKMRGEEHGSQKEKKIQ